MAEQHFINWVDQFEADADTLFHLRKRLLTSVFRQTGSKLKPMYVAFRVVSTQKSAKFEYPGHKSGQRTLKNPDFADAAGPYSPRSEFT